MRKFALISLALSFAGVIGFAAFAPAAQAADKPCARTTFKTQLIKDACTKGGQKAAKDAMKAFLKDAKKTDAGVKDCNSCHSDLKKYDLKPDALEKFKKAGGKVL
jgi:hypothetical protein